MGNEKKPAGVPAAVDALAAGLDRLADLLTQINDREAAREIDRLRDRSASGEFTPENLQDATTARGAVTLGAAASGLVMRAKPARLYAAIVNGGVNDAYLSFTNPAIAAQGILLQPGGTFTFGARTDFDYRGAIFGISTLGSVLVFVES